MEIIPLVMIVQVYLMDQRLKIAGVCNGNNIEDCAGVCGGTSVIGGCDNECGSTAVEDQCGVCNGDNSTCDDCAGVINGLHLMNVGM